MARSAARNAALRAAVAVLALSLAAANHAGALPSTQTALWVNSFAVVAPLSEADRNDTREILEEALREPYTSKGYAVDIVDLLTCPDAPVATPASSPAAPPGPRRLPGLAPAPAPAGPLAQLRPAAVSCSVLNVTLSFDPESRDLYLDAAAGTSGAIIGAIRDQTLAAGLQAQLYLLRVAVLPGIKQVVSTGESLQRVLEIGYQTSIWVAGEALPLSRSQRLAVLAAYRGLGLEARAGVVRLRVAATTQNATGFGVTILSIVRPDGAALSYPQAVRDAVADESFLAALRGAGLPGEAVSLVSLTQDNSTTLGAQLSAILGANPVVSTIGTPEVVSAASSAPQGAASAAAGPGASGGSSGLSAGAIAGVVAGSVCAAALLPLLGVLLLWRRRRRGGKLAARAPAAPPPSPDLPSAEGGSPVASAAMRTAASSTSLPISVWSHGSWQLPPHSIDICCRPDGREVVLGRGTYGVVYKALLNGEEEVAVKMLNRVDEWQLQQFQREIDLLRTLPANANVVQFYGACLDCECPFLVLEYMAGGDLRDALNNPESAPLLDWHRNGQKVALDIARGLSFLHAHGVIHADLKTKNVLLSPGCGLAKVGDVGLSRIMQGSHASACSDAFTFTYAAPEQILGYDLTAQVDSFAFSVLLWELATKEPPIRGQLHTVDSPQQCPPEVAQLIEQGLHRDPKQRPTAEEACALLAALAGRTIRVPDVDVVPQLQPPPMYETRRW